MTESPIDGIHFARNIVPRVILRWIFQDNRMSFAGIPHSPLVSCVYPSINDRYMQTLKSNIDGNHGTQLRILQFVHLLTDHVKLIKINRF